MGRQAFGTRMVHQETFWRSSCVLISTLSSRIESMEFVNRGAAPYINNGKEWKAKTRSRSEMPIWTVSQRFSHLQWRRLFKELWGRPTTTADFGSSFRPILYTSQFACWKIRFKTEVCTCSQFPTEAMQWINRSGDGWFSGRFLKSSLSVRGIRMPDFEVLDAKIASGLHRIIRERSVSSIILTSKEESVWRNKKHKKRTVSFAVGRLLTWSTNTSGSLEPMILSKITPTYSLSFYEMTIFRNALRSGMEFYCHWRKSHLTTSWKDCTKVSEKLKTVLELYDLEIHQKKLGSDYHRFKAMVKRIIEQHLRIKNFEARNGNYEKNAVVKNQGTKQREQRTLWDCWQWKANGQCSEGDNCSFRHDINKRGKVTPSNPFPSSFMQQSERKSSRTRSPRDRSPSGRMSRWPCKDCLKGTCNNSFCERWHPPECLFNKTKSGCRLGEKCSYAHRQVEPTKRSKKNDDKSAVAVLKKNYDRHENVREPVVNHVKGHDRSGRPDKKRDHELRRGPTGRRSSDARQLGCVFQDMDPPKLTSILRKSSDMQKPIQCVKFTKAIARHTKIRDQNSSLGYICLGEPHERSPKAPKFEDRSQEETEWQEQGAREAAWKLAKSKS